MFNRGQHQAELLDALRGKIGDAAIDNSQSDPAWVTKTAGLLEQSVKYYLYVSSTGVYFPYDTPRSVTEDVKPVLVDSDGTTNSSWRGLHRRSPRDGSLSMRTRM